VMVSRSLQMLGETVTPQTLVSRLLHPKICFFLFSSLGQSSFFDSLVYVIILNNAESASFYCF